MTQQTLKATVKTVVEVNGNDLEMFIKGIYGQSIEIACNEELGNQKWCTTVSKSTDELLCEYEEKRLDKFKSGENVGYVVSTILEDMANKNIITEGDYIIDVSW